MKDKLKLGVARAVITPEVGCQLYGYRPDIFSTKVADDLRATAFYFEQGDIKALMISCDVCLIDTSLSDRIRAEIRDRFGVPVENCMLSATHTHSGPNTVGEVGWGDIDKNYCENIFIPGIMNATKEAVSSPVPVKMGYAYGDSKVGINRRQITLKRYDYAVLGQNEWGCYNPKMMVISFRDENDDNIGTMIHYGCHGTSAGACTEISRDWAGIMVDGLEKVSGGIVAFFNGPEGDVGPRISNGLTTGYNNMDHVYELGNIAAWDAVDIFRKIGSYRDEEISVASGILQPPLGSRIPLEEAKAQYEKFRNNTVNASALAANHYKRIIESYENGYEEIDHFDIPQTVFRIGDVAFATFPYELFSEIGLRINKESDIPHVLSLAVTNGSENYFVTHDQIRRSGYEVQMYNYHYIQPYGDHADYQLIVDTLKNLEKLHN